MSRCRLIRFELRSGRRSFVSMYLIITGKKSAASLPRKNAALT
jgi:hypothetical protein